MEVLFILVGAYFLVRIWRWVINTALMVSASDIIIVALVAPVYSFWVMDSFLGGLAVTLFIYILFISLVYFVRRKHS
ncbi:MAG: hypothetical protein ACK4GL_12630 [Flavobacteriales bacterium]